MDFDKEAREILSVPEIVLLSGGDAARQAISQALRRAYNAGAEKAAVVAETYGVYPELNVSSGGPEWYRHGKSIAQAIRSLPLHTEER